ncbi:hypothetical protein MVEN_00962100 [Mycena venus]|uniref:Uncharacterized protein n=1 Tax=Mycena venus TaxID=2733690 RepID=A0A8H6YD45_9AGAR|nr:hypothetical protein MVEN_00962100 [Mycena venus]
MAPPLPPLPLPTKFNNCCPACGSYLTPQLTKDGDHWFLRCYKPAAHADPYNHRWPPLARPIIVPATSMADTSTTESAPSKIPCRFPAGCTSGRTNKHCTNIMCQKHCLKTGNCAYSRHHAGDSSTSISIPAIPASTPLPGLPPRASSSRIAILPRLASSSSIAPAPSNAPFPSHIPVFPGARPFRSFDDLASDFNEPLRALNAYQEAQDSAARQFDLSIGLKLPSPDLPLEEELRRQEEKDIEEAMRRSTRDAEQARRRATFQDISTTVTRPSPPPVSATNLRPRSLSPSPDPPATVLPISHAKKHSKAPIQITKQLSNDWVKPSSTFHVAAPARRPPTNPELARRFLLVYLCNVSPFIFYRAACRLTNYVEFQDPVVLCISAADLPSWPQFRLTDSPRTLSDMGIEDVDNTSLEQYSESYHIFMKVSVRHLFTLTTDCVVLLRKQGVRVPDEASIITRFLGRSTPPTSSHQRYGLSQERAGVRREYRKLKTILSDDESDVEVVGTIRKRDSTTKTLQRKRPRLSVNTAIVPINVDDDGDTSTRSTPPSTPGPLTPGSSRSSTAGPKNDKGSWMKGLHVVDMVDGFVKMDSPELAHLPTKEARFHAVFGQQHSYAPSTYDDQLRRWSNIRSSPRLWVNPLPHAFVTTMANLVLALLHNLEIPCTHHRRESILLISGMGYGKTGIFAVMVVEKRENDEGVPYVVRGESSAKLPAGSRQVANLSFRE